MHNKRITTLQPRVSDVQSDVTKSKGIYVYTCVTMAIYELCLAKIKHDYVSIFFFKAIISKVEMIVENSDNMEVKIRTKCKG